MENIDNLNFKVILDDKEFNEKVEKDIKTAKRLNASPSDYLTAKNKLKGKNSGLSARETAERKRQIDLNTKEAVSQEKVHKLNSRPPRLRHSSTELMPSALLTIRHIAGYWANWVHSQRVTSPFVAYHKQLARL